LDNLSTAVIRTLRVVEEPATDRRGLFRRAIAGVARAPTAQASDSLTRGLLGFRTASIDELLEASREVGLESQVSALRDLARHSVRIAPGLAGIHDTIAFGGRLQLPSGVDWPRYRGRPLTFLARVDSQLFFYDTSSLPSGFEAIHRGAGCVLVVGEGELVARDGPTSPRVRHPGVAVAELVIPRVWAATVEALELTEDERAAWELLRAHLASIQGTELTDQVPVDIVHRIFGYPDHTVGDMPRVCEACSSGDDFVGGRYELEHQAARWELLAQFCPDPELGWSWPGRVYFWRDREGEVWTIRQ
jgi:hypothetical protein